MDTRTTYASAIRFPLWGVRDPGPDSILCDVCFSFNSIQNVQNYMAGSNTRETMASVENLRLYTNAADARADANARLARVAR